MTARKIAVFVLSSFLLLVCGNCQSMAEDDMPNGDGGEDAGADSDADTDTDDLPPGSLIWAQHIGGDYQYGSQNMGHALAALSDGTFYAGGSFLGFAVFGAGTGNEVALEPAGGEEDADAFLGRWSANGAPLWVIGVGGDESGSGEEGPPPTDRFAEFATGQDDSVIAFLGVEDGVNLDPLGTELVTLENDNWNVIPRYADDGRLADLIDPPDDLFYANATHGVWFEQQSRLAAGADGSFAVSHGYGGVPETITLGQGEPNEVTLAQSVDGSPMDVIAVYADNGTLEWAVKLENGSPDLETLVQELAVGPDGSVVASVYAFFGYDGAEALLGNADGSVVSVTFIDDPDIDETADLLVKWDASGQIEWVKQIPPLYGPSPFFVRDDGTIVLMLACLDDVTFDPGGPGEAVIDHGPCATQFCFFAVEIAPDSSSFSPHLLERGGSHVAIRPDGSFALTTWSYTTGVSAIAGFSADYALEWEATIEPGEPESGAWIHDIAALNDGSIIVIGDYDYSAVFGQGEPRETTLHGVCDDCIYGAFLARYAW